MNCFFVDRRMGQVLLVFLLVLGAGHLSAVEAQKRNVKPNFIIILTDDQGYGDLGCYGHPTIRTPNLDRLAAEGQRWTSFYVPANVCTPSRAGLLTGRLPIRTGMYGETPRVLFPTSGGGLPQSEHTIARLLKERGYNTAAIGKWHLGHLPQYLPTSHGFDFYFGIPYSNDMNRVNDVNTRESILNPKIEYFQVPLFRNMVEVERPADQSTITKRYTEQAIEYIERNRDKPFFLYLAHSLPHVPLFASKSFLGKSERGLYGDVIEEIDWSVGEILKALAQQGLDKETYVIFTSDNGPWAIFNEHAGSAGLLYGAKGTSYEGGVRVPAIFWCPNRVNPGVISGIGSTLDFLPTIIRLAGGTLPTDRIFDGYDLSPVLHGKGASPREEMFFYHSSKLFAVRKGNFKLYFYSNDPLGSPAKVEKLEKVQLYNLQHDPSEKYDVADRHPDIVREIQEMAERHLADLTPAPSLIQY